MIPMKTAIDYILLFHFIVLKVKSKTFWPTIQFESEFSFPALNLLLIIRKFIIIKRAKYTINNFKINMFIFIEQENSITHQIVATSCCLVTMKPVNPTTLNALIDRAVDCRTNTHNMIIFVGSSLL